MEKYVRDWITTRYVVSTILYLQSKNQCANDITKNFLLLNLIRNVKFVENYAKIL